MPERHGRTELLYQYRASVCWGDKNGTTQSYTYDGRPIESRIWSIEQRHFQRPWTTPTPDLKVTPFFDAEYLRNGRR